jgi:hypothetical protein
MAITTVPAAMSGVPYTLQAAQATGNGNALAIPVSFRNHVFQITAAAGVTAGAVQIEGSFDPNDSGTWGLIVAIPTVVIAGADILIQVNAILPPIIRARISTTISGGGSPSVTVIYNGAKSY